jgi:leader peptidase (prepilin peptidase)/N-methyltransferase
VQYFEIGIWAVLGLIMGSFVNVCLARLPLQFADNEKRSRLLTSPETPPFLKKHIRDQSLSLSKPARSFCFSCGHQLRWFENIPVLSYLLSSGRCRKCNAAIGIKSIWTETIHGLVYLVFGWFLNGWILPLAISINFSFLWILGNCWNCQQLRKVLSFAGAILLSLNLGVYFY